MKILFVTDLYPLGNEKVAKALYYIVEEWIKLGHDVEVIRSSFVLNNIIRGKKIGTKKIYYQNGIKIYNVNFFTPFWFNVYNKLPKYFSLKNYDVIISHMPCGALLANKLLKRDKIKYVCAVHSSDIKVLTDFKYSIYFRNALKKAYFASDATAARSPVLQCKIEELIPEISEKTFVAYSGLQDELTDTELCQKPFNKKNVKIATAAKLIKRKNIDLIIKALDLTDDDRYTLTVIGDGKERKNLEKLVKKLNLTDRVNFTGYIDRKEVIKELAKSDIFVLLSDEETFGLVYLEAMLCGNIVIGKKNDGIDGILQNEKNAFLIEKTPEALYHCLNKITMMKTSDINKIKAEAESTLKDLSQNSAAKEYIRNINNLCLFYNKTAE